MESENNGLKLVLSVVVFIFLIGLVVFIFALFGGYILDSESDGSTGTINESITYLNGTGSPTSVAGQTNVQLTNVEVYSCGG